LISDNYGSKYIGRYRLNMGIDVNSPFGYGDRFGANGLVSTETDLKNGRIYYNFPLMNNGLRGEASFSKTTYELGDIYDVLDATGSATIFEGALDYPLIRTRLQTLRLSFNLARKFFTDKVGNVSSRVDKDSIVGTFGVGYLKEFLFFGLNSKITASLDYALGDLSFEHEEDLKADKAGPMTNGRFSKVGGRLEQYIQFSPFVSLNTKLRFQHALGNKNLDGSEDFSIGGPYGVKAFPGAELSAENGYVFSMELFYVLPEFRGLTNKSSLFADTGYARMENPTGATEARQLSDLGIGYYANYGYLFATAYIAKVVGPEKVTSEPEHSTRISFQIGMYY